MKLSSNIGYNKGSNAPIKGLRPTVLSSAGAKVKPTYQSKFTYKELYQMTIEFTITNRKGAT